MIIDCTLISDLHGFHPELPGGDLLIVSGDLTATDTERENDDFWRWLCYQNYKKMIVVAGNHDNFMQKNPDALKDEGNTLCYLCDSGTEFEGLKIWGCPHSLLFHGINPRCTAFSGTEEDLKKKYDLIPDGIDILISHSPAFGILDENSHMQNCGSKSLLEAIKRVKPRLVVHGHIHEQGSKIKRIFHEW